VEKLKKSVFKETNVTMSLYNVSTRMIPVTAPQTEKGERSLSHNY